VGVEDLIIVEAGDAVLVAHKDRAQDVKKIVESLQKQGRSESEIHRRVYRPWGWYEGIDREERFQVKRIMVKPGAQLSLQRHYHRAEHWVVVSGTAEVVRGTETLLLSENQSIYIPLGMLHRLHNPGHIPLHLIEVQSGSYLGEDDIVRVEDHYGRLDDATAHNQNGSQLPASTSTDESAATLDTSATNSSMHPTIQATPHPGIQGGGLFGHMVSPAQPVPPPNPNRRRHDRRGHERRSADRRRGERRTKAQIAQDEADELAAQAKVLQESEFQESAEVLAHALTQAQQSSPEAEAAQPAQQPEENNGRTL
jgi:mannose-6-phosphate isomerase-like protein (cupin superfamily)